MKLSILSLLLFYSFLIGLDNETLIYNLKFLDKDAGESTLSIKNDKKNNVYSLISSTKTNKLFDKLYKIRSQINITLDPLDFSILKIEKKEIERKKRKLFRSIIDYDKMLAISNEKTIRIPKKVYNPFGLIYYLRDKNIALLDTFSFKTYDNDKLKDIKIIAKTIETIKVPFGEFECILAEPEGKLLKGSMRIWFTNDAQKIPIKIERTTKNGVLKMLLKNID